jgi:predicted Zn-dependent protease
MPIEPSEALAEARAIVARSPAFETEVAVDAIEERFVRFADAGPTQSADRERCDVAIRVRVRQDGGLSEAKATAATFSPRDTDAALERALALARAGVPDPRLEPLGGPVEVPESAADETTRRHSFAAKADWVCAALDACGPHALDPAGLASTQVVSRALCNSRGRAVHGTRSRASFALTASSANGSGFAQHIAARAAAIDARAVALRAVDKAVRARVPRGIEPGEYAVVLEPAAVSALITFAAVHGFGAQAVLERASFLCGRIGERALSESLTIVDDVRHPLLQGIPFDGEGTPTRRVLLVDRGAPTGPVTDRATAVRLSLENSGHALSQPNPDGPRPQHLAILCGGSSVDELVSRIGRGLFVSDLHYVNLIESRELLLTGVTRNGTYWIEDGRVTHAVKNLRFTQSLVGALQRIVGVGCEAVASSSALEGDVVSPALAIDRFRFTSTTEF